MGCFVALKKNQLGIRIVIMGGELFTPARKYVLATADYSVCLTLLSMVILDEAKKQSKMHVEPLRGVA